MPSFDEPFAHGGEHLENDAQMARVILFLMAIAAVAFALLVIVGVRA